MAVIEVPYDVNRVVRNVERKCSVTAQMTMIEVLYDVSRVARRVERRRSMIA